MNLSRQINVSLLELHLDQWNTRIIIIVSLYNVHIIYIHMYSTVLKVVYSTEPVVTEDELMVRAETIM